jgi:hypothetical protein
MDLKPFISALADVTITQLTPDDEFVIGESSPLVFSLRAVVATDGFWDAFSSQDAVQIVQEASYLSWFTD